MLENTTGVSPNKLSTVQTRMILATSQHVLLPIIDGLHTADGLVYPIVLDAHGYTTAAGPPLKASECAVGFATLHLVHEFATDDDALLLCAGDGAWEGEGFLALVDRYSRNVLWILYAEQAENFVSARREQGIVYAVSEDGPYRFHWRIRDTMPLDIVGQRVRTG